MNSDPAPNVSEWLPKLSLYRDALEDSTHEEQSLETDVDPQGRLGRGLHSQYKDEIPVGPIASQVMRSSSYVLGMGFIGDAAPSTRSRLTYGVASSLHQSMIGGRILVIEWVNEQHPMSGPVSEIAGMQDFDLATWHRPGESKSDKIRWSNQLSQLVEWRRQYRLTLINIGSVNDQTNRRIARLGDGLVLAIGPAENERKVRLALRDLQADRLSILGAWSLETSQSLQPKKAA